MITVVVASRQHEDRLDCLTPIHASLTRQSVSWEAVNALDGASPDRLPIPLAEDPRVRTLALPRPVGAACARNLALNQAHTRCTNRADNDDEFTDDAMSVRLDALESTGVGWSAGWGEDQHSDGPTTLWRCPTPPGRHKAGDVWTYWKSPTDPIPIGPTTIPARTDLVRAAPMGGLVQGEDYGAALGVTCLAPGIPLPVPVYKNRKWDGQMTARDGYDQPEAAAREHAWAYGRSLRAVLRHGQDLVHG
ncbi:glycosyltransferase family 2 protein [Streptomyces sp. SID1121]|uniref:glycosyltransferase family 2 protein n=1 Tax=Streptomyces sp. SID1121 TaxID=3425888 RepID=UPI004057548F